MAADLIVTSEADADLNRCFDWYEQQRLGLGESFVASVEACIQSICRHPTLHAVVMYDYRRALLRRFPYAVFYSAADNTVTVYAILHTSRHPRTWRQRLP